MVSLIFALSGCAELMYEVVWLHLVQLVVGGSFVSVAVLRCGFMGGMAAGPWLPAKAAPRADPFRIAATPTPVPGRLFRASAGTEAQLRRWYEEP